MSETPAASASGGWARVTEMFEHCLERPSHERALWLDRVLANEPDLRHEVESLLAAHESAGEFLEIPALDGTPPQQSRRRMGPWETIEEIGRGGLGQIFRARRADGQYDQEVAIKLLRAGLDSDEALHLFERERRILAQMNHPHIARLLDAGVAENQPYFVMELVDGIPIDRFVELHRLSRPARLLLFVKVCQAVEYAHQRLVLHRDLKPANVLVTAEGEPKLLDFGIASMMSGGQSEASLFLTPEYASPEQLRSESVTTATDVYSLGVVLYQILAGRRPYQLGVTTTPTELEQAIQAQPLQVPVPDSPDLNSIAVKALEKDAVRRYASAGHLAEDIGKCLRGYPVSARPASARYRALCFVRRNRWGVAAAALVLASLTAGLAGTLWQWRQAQTGRVEAELRFQEVRKLARSVLYEFDDSVRDIPGTTAARALMLSRAVEYLDRLSASNPADPVLRTELGEAYLRAGEIAGRNGAANLGKPEEARRHFEHARKILESTPLVDVASRRVLARTYNDLGGLDNARRALTIYERNLAAEPSDRRRDDLANGYYYVASSFTEKEEWESAMTWRQKELEIRRALYASSSSTAAFRSNYALCSKRMGGLLIRLDRLTEAMRHYRTALEIEEQWRQAEPASAEARMALSYSHSDIGFILNRQDRFAEALAHYRQTVELREQAAAADPRDARAVGALESAYFRIAPVLLKLGRRREALDSINRALKMAYAARRPPAVIKEYAQIAADVNRMMAAR